jgi:hypothetical protein
MSVLLSDVAATARSHDAGWVEAVISLDPTFRVHGVAHGAFELDGRQVDLVVEPEGWLVGSTPLGGAADRWFAQQSRIPTFAKVVEGPALQVDIPIQESLGAAFTTLRAILREAVSGLAAGGTPTAGDSDADAVGAADRAAGEALDTYAASSPWLVLTEAGGFTLLVETARDRQQRITAKAAEGRVRLTALLAPSRANGPASSRALAHFMLTLNARVRLVRGSVGDAGVRLEVVLPSWVVNVDLVDRAIGALIAAAATARRECAALLVPAVAEAYCAFHRVGAPSGEGAADVRIRAPRQERSIP